MDNVTKLHHDGHTLEVRRDVIAVDTISNSEADPKWRVSDRAGHIHRWDVERHMVVRQLDDPESSVVWVETSRWWCDDCREDHVETEPRCRECRGPIDMARAYRDLGPGRQFITGAAEYRLDGEVIDAETARLWVERLPGR